MNELDGLFSTPVLNEELRKIRRIADGSDQFIELIDTPSTYSGQSLKYVQVNSTEDGVQFVTLAVAPNDASYVVMGLNGDLTSERVLTQGDNMSITDGGANGNVTLDAVPSGNDTEIQYNDSGSFGADSGLTWDDSTGLFTTTYAVDGSYVAHQITNSQTNSGGSTNETDEIKFGFGSDDSVAKILIGKGNDYTSGGNSDSFMGFYTDYDGTLYEFLRLDDRGNLLLGKQGTSYPTVTAGSSGNIILSTLSAFPASAGAESVILGASNTTGSTSDAGLIVLSEGGSENYIGDGAVFGGTTNVSEGTVLATSADNNAVLAAVGKNTYAAPGQLTLGDDLNSSRVLVSWIYGSGTAMDDSRVFERGMHFVIESSVPDGRFEFDAEDSDSSNRVSKEIGMAIFRRKQHYIVDGTTLTDWREYQFWAPTVNGASGGGTETVNNAATVYIENAPSGSDITWTNGPYALWVDDGTTRLDGDLEFNGDIFNTGVTINTPSGDQSITGVSDDISADATTIRLDPDGDYTLTSTPTIADGTDGQIVYITANNAEANVVTVQDQDTLGGSNLQLGDTSRAISGKDVLVLMFDGTDWIEISYANN